MNGDTVRIPQRLGEWITLRQWLCVMIFCGLGSVSGATADAPSPLTQIIQVRRLTSEAAQRSFPVDLTGVVSFANPKKQLLFVQDATGGIFVYPEAKNWDWRTGQKVRVTGVTAPGIHLPCVNLAQLQDLGAPGLPLAQPVTFTHLAENTEDGNWVEIRGIVRSAQFKSGQLWLEIAAEGKRLQARFAEAPDSMDLADAWVDAEVRVQGVCGLAQQDKNNPCFVELHVQSPANVVVLTPATAQPALQTIGSLNQTRQNPPPQDLAHRTRVQGLISVRRGGAWQVTDPTGSLELNPLSNPPLETNLQAELTGFPAGDAAHPVLEDATVQYLAPGLPEHPESRAGMAPEILPLLVQNRAIRQLPLHESTRGYPVRVRGIVTYVDSDWGMLFFLDESAGIYIHEFPFAFKGTAGQRIEVKGYTGAGRFAPVIRATNLQVLGTGKFPNAKPASLDQLLSGGEDGQWVELSGTLRRVKADGHHVAMQLHTPGGMLTAFIADTRTNLPLESWVDAEATLRGVCGSQFNQTRQIVGAQLFMPNLEHVRLTRPAPANPFALPLQPINQLLQFQPQNQAAHRVHVRGIVTWRSPQSQTVFIQDDQAGLPVTLAAPGLTVGDLADLAGFISPTPFGPEMTEALSQSLGAGTNPIPRALTLAQASASEFNSRLMTLEGNLVERTVASNGCKLVLQGEQWNFLASLAGDQDAPAPQALRKGSRLRLTGVGRLQTIENQAAGQLVLHLRSAADITLLSQPPWWTYWHWVGLLAFLLAVVGITSAWVALLRRNVHRQTEVIRNRLAREAALEAQYHGLFDNVNDLIQSLYPDGRIMFVNPAWQKALGYSLEEAARLRFTDIIHPDDLPHCRQLLAQVMNGTSLSHVEARFRGKTGNVIEVEGSCTTSFDQDQLVAIRGIFHDITARKRAEQVIKHSQAQLAAIYDGAPLMICLVNEHNEIEQMNRTMQEFANLSLPATGKIPAGDLFSCLNARTSPQGCGHGEFCPACPLRLAITQTFQTGQSCQQVEHNLTFTHNDEHQDVWVSISTALVRLDEDAKVLVCLADISRRKQLEAQFLQSQKMEAIGQLAGGVAHDFNNILAATMLNIGILRRLPNLSPAMLDGLLEVETQSKRAANLTRQLLLFSRRQAMEIKTQNLSELLTGLMKMLSRLLGEHIAIEMALPAEPLWINADTGMIEQLVINLCVNARDAMPTGGQLRLAAGPVSLGLEHTQLHREARAGAFVRLIVQDTGCGMSEATLKRIFEPFFTTKEPGKGTGLGLATVHGIIQQHHGWVEVESVVNRGTLFRVYLPATRQNLPANASVTLTALAGGNETILLVEDDESLRGIAQATLQKQGYRVVDAPNGAAALRVWETYHAEVALLLTDMVMPGGITGLELAERLIREKPTLRVVIATGYSPDLAQGTAKLPVGMKMLSKPYTLESLSQAVRQSMDANHRAERQTKSPPLPLATPTETADINPSPV